MSSCPGPVVVSRTRHTRSFARRGSSRLVGTVSSALLVAGLLIVTAPVARADAPAPPCTGNAIVCENALPGTPQSVWDVNGAGDSDIQGFATQISVNIGQTVQFKIDTNASAYKIEIYRLGYYQGNGARKQAEVLPSAALPQIQPACATDATTEIYDCGTWGVSASWAVPATAVSGVYIAQLIRTDNGDSSHIPFIVRDDSSHSDVVYQTSDPTWQAYNLYGQSDFYQGLANGRAYKVSYNRPITTRGQNAGRDFLFSNEYPMIRYMEQNGYDVSYISGLDTDIRGGLLTNHKVFMDVGHDEYWSAGQRSNVTAARDAGVSLAFFSGNEVYWKTRWEASEDGTSTANRTLVCYKDTWAKAKIDPLGPTATWRDPRWGGNGMGPENSLTGTMYMSNNTDLAITVSAAEGATRLWRNTPLATQAPGTSTSLQAHTVGYESDEDLDNGHRPAGLVDLSTTTGPTPQYLQDFGNIVAPGTTTHHVTLYKAASGALVFGAGTIQWAWGVDPVHDGTDGSVDENIRQATMNILADMGASATTAASDLVHATKSPDTTAPVAVITSPAANSASQQGSLVTVTGTATDTGGGVVAGVEVSVDGGLTWHPAPISGSGAKRPYTYTGVLTGTGARAIQVRATDDSGNIQSPVTSLPLQVSCPCSLFGAVTPVNPSIDDSSAVTLGVKFTSSADGFITGIRFYKGAGNGGTHVGTLYDSTGNVLSSVTFTGETATGWQNANFTSAVPISAGVTYVASYTAPLGHYAGDNYYFISSGHSAGTLTALGGSVDQNNGVYLLGTGFPTTSYQNTNYYVDAVYSATDTTPLSATAGTPLAGSSSVLTSTSATATFSRSITPASINMSVANAANVAVPGTVTYDPTVRQVTFNPTQPLNAATTYTVRLSATSPDVGAMAAPVSWSFTTANSPAAPGVCPCSLFADTSAPTTGPVRDSPVQLGTAFTSDLNGTITGIRFYRDPTNTGPHTVSLYTAAGSVMGTATTTSETTSGWQTATFTSPIPINSGTTYIAAYSNSSGHYSYTSGGLASAVNAAPLHTPAAAGRYAYSGAPTGPSSANYFVDPVFAPGPDSAPVVASVDPSDNSTSVPLSASVTATFSSSVQASSVGISVIADDGTNVPGSVANESLGTSVIFVPSAALTPATHYTVTVSGAISAGGTAMTTPSVSHFTTSGVAACPCSVFASGAVPGTSDSGDTGPISVGLKFTPTSSGSVTGIRYYRDAANTGTHTGTLYGADGTKLTSLTFPNSTTTGWQTATFATPIVVTAGTTYVAAAYMPVGHYSVNSSFFSAPYVNVPLTGVVGLFTYGSDSFPTSTYNNGNYWVDVLFSPGPAQSALTVAAQNPTSGASGISTSVTPSASFSAAINPASLQMTVTGPGGVAVTGAASYDPATFTATLTPSSPLAAASTYTVSVGATPSSGAAMAAPATWSFTTVSPAAPQVAAKSPSAGATGVSPTVTPTATFSIPVNVSTLQFSLSGPGGTSIPGVGSIDPTSLIATFTPTSALAPNTLYIATVTATSTTGIPLAVPLSWTFTTIAPAAPTVSGQVPAASATAVATDSLVSGTFSAPITQSTVVFTVTGPDNAAVPGTTAYNPLTNTATFTPTAGLASNTSYAAGLSATGANGGVMATPSKWSFTTTAAPGATVSGQTPAAGAASVLVTSSVSGTFNIPITASTLVFTLVGPGGAAVTGTASYVAATGVATFVPKAALSYGTAYTASVAATATTGGLMAAPATWSFTTAAAGVPAVSGQSPAGGSTGAAIAVSPTAVFSIPITTSTLQFSLSGPGGVAVASAVSYNSTTRTATLNPSANLAYGTLYTASLQATSSVGGAMTAPVTWSFTTIPAAVATVSNQSPASGATGVAISVSPTGTFSIPITTSTLQFTLTGPAGPVVGTTSFNTSSRVATFKPTASLAYSTAYTASLIATSSVGGLMASPATWSFTTVAAPAPTVSALSPASGATTVTSGSLVTGTFSIAIAPATLAFTVTAAGGTQIPGVATYNATTRVASFDPTSALPFGTMFTASLSATSTVGGLMANPVTWSFTTTPAFTLNSLWAPTDSPSTITNGGTAQTTLGVSFYSDKASSVTAIKFYAGPNNTGTHPVALWSSTGTLLGSGSSATTVVGWNTVALTTPVAITAGTTYVATYTAPVGGYSTTSFAYLFTRTNGIMHARSNAGLSKAGNAFPTSASTTNYWVDPVVSVPNP